MKVTLILSIILLLLVQVNAQGLPNFKDFIPEHCVKSKSLRIDFDGDNKEEWALTYTKIGPRDKDSLLYFPENVTKEDIWNSGLKILKYSDSLGWFVAYEEKAFTGNGVGVWGPPTIAIIYSTTSKKKGLLVSTEVSGAGSISGWELLISSGGKIISLGATKLRDEIFKKHGIDPNCGYNSVTSTTYLIIETQPGFSKTASCCCPDMPALDMVFQLSNDSLILNTVVQRQLE